MSASGSIFKRSALSGDGELPYSREAEQAVLASILLDGTVFFQVATLLHSEDFFIPGNRIIFLRMQDLAERAVPVDQVTLAEELIRNKELESIGGASYISSLTNDWPRVANVQHYIDIVKDKALLRRLIKAAQAIEARSWEASESAQDILDEAQRSVFSIAEYTVRSGFLHINEVFKTNFESLDALHDRGKRVTGLETGFREFDDMTRGLQPSELIVVAGRPSMGKTSFALDVARWAAVQGKRPVGIFSIEMSAPSLVLRLLCSEADVNSHKLQAGFASRDDWTKMAMALSRLVSAPIFIDDTPGMSIMEMRSKARMLKEQNPDLGLLMIDYMQLMSGGGKYENRTQEVSAISRGLKSLAKELSVPVIAVSQLSRAAERRDDNRPKLADLRESGQIEQDADLVAFIFREEMVMPKTEENRGRAELIIAKQRNGPVGTVKLVFLPEFTSFRNPPEAFGPSEVM